MRGAKDVLFHSCFFVVPRETAGVSLVLYGIDWGVYLNKAIFSSSFCRIILVSSSVLSLYPQ
jgi:hypothetical protein